MHRVSNAACPYTSSLVQPTCVTTIRIDSSVIANLENLDEADMELGKLFLNEVKDRRKSHAYIILN